MKNADPDRRSSEPRSSRRAVSEETAPGNGDRGGESGPARRSRDAGRRRSGKDRTEAAPSSSGRRSRAGRNEADQDASGQPLDPVSKFSASALRRVSVLGDRPNQVVHSLAQQSRRKRGGFVLIGLLGMTGLALLSLLGVLVVQMLGPGGGHASVETPIVEPPEGHSRLQPALFHSQEQLDLFDTVAERGEDTEPLSEEEVFGSAEQLELEGFELSLHDAEYTDVCTSVVWGEALAESLAESACAGAARGVYQDGGEEYVAQFTLFDLADADGSAAVAEELDPESPPPGFVLPMDTDITGLNEGYSQATAQVMGRYLAVVWVARADGAEPEDGDDSMAGLNVAAMDAAVAVYRRVSEAE